MPPPIPEDGTADSQERMELVFQRHHAALSAESACFETWNAAWERRQDEIDRSLEELKQKILSGPERPFRAGFSIDEESRAFSF